LDELRVNLTRGAEIEASDGLTEGLLTQTNMQTGVMPMAASSSIMGIYTAGVTGRG
jgi:hypothetical protein